MKIAIDISQIVYGTGVSVYTKELVRGLLEVAPQHEYILYAGVLRRKDDIKQFVETLTGNVRLVTWPIPPRVAHYLWNSARPFPFETVLGTYDVLHTSDWTEPPSRHPKVTTIHDLSPLLYPHVTSPLLTQVFEKKIALVREDHDQVITPSLTIANEVLSMHIDSSRVHTISEAPNPELLAAPRIDVHQKFGIPGSYILMVGTAERKNIHRSYDAFCLVNRPDTSLVIVGEPNKHLPINPRIIYTGFVTTHELSNLYQNAIVFLYPSLYEGFGLPILEAYALGCPVVTSNVGSMQELSQEAAILVNPYDVHGIANGVKQALADKSSLIKKAKRLVKNYTWRHTARETLKIYTKAYEHR